MNRAKTVGLRPLAVALAFALGACAQFTKVGPDEVMVSDAIEVRTPIAWSRLVRHQNEIWTIDGTGLEELRFAVGIEDDTPAFALSGDAKLPVFRSNMTPVEVAELVVASLSVIGFPDTETSNLRPVTVGGARGFRFELTTVAKDGLELQGFAVGTVRSEKLYLVIYSGAKLYYFDRYRPAVEKMIRSIRFL